jgi:hypothetical protein
MNKIRAYISNFFPDNTNNVSFQTAQMENLGGLDQSFGWYGGTRVLRFGLVENVYKYKGGGGYGEVVVPGDPDPDGTAGTAGTSPQPCTPPATIGYTTQQMQGGESQSLSVVGGGIGVYTWEVTAGGGHMDGSTYVAPSTNPNCADNPTITLYCNGSLVQDTLDIAVNIFRVSTSAYIDIYEIKNSIDECKTIGTGCYHVCPMISTAVYDCMGVYRIGHDTPNCGLGAAQGGECTTNKCAALIIVSPCSCDNYTSLLAGLPEDVRSAETKEAGCCPEALL